MRRLVPEKNPKRHKLLQLGSKPVNDDDDDGDGNGAMGSGATGYDDDDDDDDGGGRRQRGQWQRRDGRR